MSDDYIKREDAVKAVSKVDDYGDGVGFEVRSHCLVELKTLPPADVVERKSGEWIIEAVGINYMHKCPLCGWFEYHAYSDTKPHNFCPNCGARMFAKDTNVPNKEGADDE